MYNLLIGGAAGQGIDTMAVILEKVLKRCGYSVLPAETLCRGSAAGNKITDERYGKRT